MWGVGRVPSRREKVRMKGSVSYPSAGLFFLKVRRLGIQW